MLLFCAVAAFPEAAAAVDLRAEKARRIGDEILARRHASSPKAKPAPVVDPYEAAISEARARLATLDAQIEDKRRAGEAEAAPREKLAAHDEELAAAATKIEEQGAERAGAIYRSAGLGAGAAGWHPDPAKSARLSRYLASVAAADHDRLAKVEVERGSVMASLDKARKDDAAAAAELHSLEADRVEADARLARVTEEAEDRARHSEVAAADAESGEPEAEPSGEPQLDAASGVPLAEEPGDGSALPSDLHGAKSGAQDDAQMAAIAAATAKLAAARAAGLVTTPPPLAPPGAGPGVPGAAPGDDFHWPSEQAKTPAAAADLLAMAKAEQAAPAKAASSANADDAADDDPEMDDGPAVLAPSGEGVAAPAPESAAGDAAAAKPKGLLTRLFSGDDSESDAFAATHGSLPAPVAGKVVANYGQQHKSGATYRGVILRASHGAAIKAVATGRVSFAGVVPGLGNTVIVSHGSRYHTVYARLGDLEVKEGDRVTSGTEVGHLPDDDADMHFELRDQGKAIDPLPWLKGALPGAAH